MASDMNKSTSIIVGVLALLILVGGIIWITNNNDDSSVSDTSTDTSQLAESSNESQDIVALAVATPDLSTLVTAVQAADLVETLQSEGPFTVFAPTNEAFGALPDGTLDTLLQPENKDQLAAILTYHVVAGEVMSSDLSDGQVVETVQGNSLTVSIRDGNVYLVDATGGEAQVVTPDVKASNGVVHVINSVVLPE